MDPTEPIPLGRFLPALPVGIATRFLAEKHLPPGSLILDPFGTSPQLLVELASAGYRVLTAANNPINRFLIEMEANPPTREELQSSLAELASSRKGEDHLEDHLKALYQSGCPNCGEIIQVREYLWERNDKVPYSKLLDCPFCGIEGEFPSTSSDQQVIDQLAGTTALHRARALERVAGLEDPDRVHAQETLDYYFPRALYCLVTIFNKVENLMLTQRQRRNLLAMLLSMCDEINTLWPHPPDRPRPRQLVIPPHFREKNAWLALEKSVELWSSQNKSFPVTSWPTLPTTDGAICIFEGPLRELCSKLDEFPVKAVLTVLPRPNQAYWSLSALWAGWLWGREAVAPFKQVLRRERYDWNWHASALQSAFKSLSSHLALNIPFFALLPEPEPSFLSAALLAGDSSGFDLRAIALRSAHDPIQIHWQRRAFPIQDISQVEHQEIREALQKYIMERAEPVTYLHIHCTAMAFMADEHKLNWQGDAISDVHRPLLEVLESGHFSRIGGTKASLETGLWAIPTRSASPDSLPDRVEKAVVEILSEQSTCPNGEIESIINRQFPGLYTPQLGILQNILASYANHVENGWQLRPEDQPDSRQADFMEMKDLLTEIGNRLNYRVSFPGTSRQPIHWSESEEVCFIFYIIDSGRIGGLVFNEIIGTGKHCIVLPGSRAGLVAYKLERDPLLQQMVGEWQLLKFRQLRSLAKDKNLSRKDWLDGFSTDPIIEPEQMRMF